jgi:peptide/nickel transport system substrate-binding protein
LRRRSMKIRFRLSMLISTLVVFCLTMMFLVNNPQKSLAQDASTLTIAFAQEPDTLNFYYSSMSFAQWADNLLQADLYDYDDKLQPVPVLLKEIPTGENGGISKDGLTLTLHLKPGLKWSDGQPITAHDIKFTFDMCLDKANNFVQCATQADPDAGVTSVKEVDATTVTVTTKIPAFPENILAVTSAFYPLPSHIFEPIYKNAVAHPATAAPTPVGTEQPAAPPGLIQNADESLNPTVFSGPYTLKAWKRGESLTFAANPNYVFGEPKIKTVVIKIFPDPQTQYAAFASGQVDYVPNLQPPDTSTIGKLFSNPKDVTFLGIPGGFVEALWFNQFKDGTGPKAGAAALKDPVVRHALEMAINRKGLVKDLLLDQTIPLQTFYTATPSEDKSVKFVDYDAAAAEKMLDAAGYVKGADGIRAKGDVRLEFNYATTTSAVRKKNQIYIQQNLEDIGIKVNF